MVIALPRKRLGCQYRANYNAKHQIKTKSKKLGTRFLHFGSTIELWFNWTSLWICFRISSPRDAKKGANAKRRKKGRTYNFFVRWLWYCRGRRLTDDRENAQNTSLCLSRDHRRRHTIEHFSRPISSPRWPHFHLLELRSPMGAIMQTRVKYVEYGRMDLCVQVGRGSFSLFLKPPVPVLKSKWFPFQFPKKRNPGPVLFFLSPSFGSGSEDQTQFWSSSR